MCMLVLQTTNEVGPFKCVIHFNSQEYSKWKFDSLSFCLETTSQLMLSEGLKKTQKMPKSLPYTKIQIPTLTLHFHSPKLREFKILM